LSGVRVLARWCAALDCFDKALGRKIPKKKAAPQKPKKPVKKGKAKAKGRKKRRGSDEDDDDGASLIPRWPLPWLTSRRVECLPLRN
jgi:hypothetical protein